MALLSKDGKVIANASQTIVSFNTEAEYDAWVATLPNGEDDFPKFFIIKTYEKAPGAYIEVADREALVALPENKQIEGCLYFVIDIEKFYIYNGTNFVAIATETTGNKVTILSEESTNTQYPSAKAVYDFVATQIGDIETILHDLNSGK